MTNKDAVKLIQEIEEDGRNVTKEHIEALGLAITALEEIPEYPFYAEAYQTGYEEAKKEFERPQGDWIITNREEEFYDEVFCLRSN